MTPLFFTRDNLRPGSLTITSSHFISYILPNDIKTGFGSAYLDFIVGGRAHLDIINDRAGNLFINYIPNKQRALSSHRLYRKIILEGARIAPSYSWSHIQSM